MRRLDLKLLDRVRSDYIQGLQFARFGALEHLRQREAVHGGDLPPLFAKLAGLRNRVIPRQEVGIKAHIGGAARVCVVGEADELSSRNEGTEVHQRPDIASAKLRTEYDNQIRLAAKLVAQ